MPECSGSAWKRDACRGRRRQRTRTVKCCCSAFLSSFPTFKQTSDTCPVASQQFRCDVLAACWTTPTPAHFHCRRHILSGVMGSKLTRQRSLDIESKLNKRRHQQNDVPREDERSGGRSGGDFLFTSLMLKSDKLPGMLRKTNQSPYVRRVAWVREIQKLLREQKMEQAGEVLKLLRKVGNSHDLFTTSILNICLQKKKWFNEVLFKT